MSLESNNICTVILAGGRGQRMEGRDKGLIKWQDKPLIEHVLSALTPDTDNVIINANRNIDRYKSYGFPVTSDSLDNYQGPLAGILAAMQICSHDYLLCLPCDSPLPPDNLAERLITCMQKKQSDAAIAHDGNRTQPLFSLLKCSVQQALANFLAQGNRKVHDFFNQLPAAVCDFSDQADRFNNFNSPEDMQ
ncbi:MAG: molybdenum cofactor guanylyltransferase [Gammaproteobacteria bacterium]|nr:molybdenum cofactor guanylyltransferase [Gammaproteobacteria bacterium]